MRPLPSNARTALLFYLIFVGMIVFLNLWSQAGFETSVYMDAGLNKQTYTSNNREKTSEPNSPPQARFDVVDLTYLQKVYKENLDKLLAGREKDYRAAVKSNREKLLTKRFGLKLIKWIYSESAIVVPAELPEKKIIKLGSEWIDLANTLGLTVNDIKCGYTKNHLWFSMSGSPGSTLFNNATHVTFKNIIIFKVTFIQPLKKSKGIRLEPRRLIPRLRPEFTAPENIKPLPEATKPLTENAAIYTPPQKIKKQPSVAIIIDDIGFTRNPADEMLKIPAPLTWSVLPFTPYADIYIEAAKKRGFEIMLHLPLEPIQEDADPGPGVIKQDWSEQEIIRQFNDNLQQIPGAVGVNNHMGSAGTQNSRLMQILMATIKQKNLFFVDSLTAPGSLAEKYAGIYQVPFAKRKIFIDNDPDLESQKEKLHELIKLALIDGEAIGIAHAREGSAAAIIEMLPEFARAGVEIVPVSKLVK